QCYARTVSRPVAGAAELVPVHASRKRSNPARVPEVGEDRRVPRSEHPRLSRIELLLLVVGVAVLALNLRPAAVSVGPLLAEIRDGLDMTAFEVGILTALPVLSFAVLGGLTPAVARRVGMHRLTLLALLFTTAGLGLRAI